MRVIRRLYAVKGEVIVPLALLAYATYYYLEVRSLSRPDVNLLLIQPVYFILLVAVLLFIGQVVRRAIRETITEEQQPPTSVPGDDSTTGKIHPMRSLAFGVTTIGYILLIAPVGFVTMSAIYLVVLSYLLGVKSWLLLTLVPLVVVGGLYAVMEIWLNLSLPTGIAW